MIYISFDSELFMLTCNGNATKIEGPLVILYKTILKCSSYLICDLRMILSHKMESSHEILSCICQTVSENVFKYYGCIRVYRPAANRQPPGHFSNRFYIAGPVVENDFVT